MNVWKFIGTHKCHDDIEYTILDGPPMGNQKIDLVEKSEYEKLLKTADEIINKLSNMAPHDDENLDVFAILALGYGPRRRTDR